MSGLDMLAATNGFMQGFRFGREIMGDDPESRKLRAEYEAQQVKTASEGRKSALETARLGLDVRKADDDQTYRQSQLANKDEDQRISQQNADSSSLSARTSAGRLDLERRDKDNEEAFRQNAANQMGAFSAVVSGKATPEQQQTFDRIAPWFAQDAARSADQLQGVLTTAAGLHQQGKVREADAVFSTPEGRAALNDATGPLLNQQKGMALDSEGKFVVGNTKSAGVIRDAKTNELALQLEVTKVPSEQYADQLRKEYEKASPQRKQQIEAELQPKAYTTVLTHGRTPLDQGGEVRWFKPQDFQQFTGSLNRLAYLQQQHPEVFTDLRRRLESNMGAKNEQEGTKLYLQRSDAAAKDSEVRAEQQRDNARQDQKTMLQGVDSALNNRMPPWTEGDETAAAKRLHVSNIRTKAYDAILSGKAKSVDEAIKFAEGNTVAPMSDRISSLISGTGPTSTEHSPEVKDIGDKLRRGEITREQAVQEWAKLGVR